LLPDAARRDRAPPPHRRHLPRPLRAGGRLARGPPPPAERLAGAPRGRAGAERAAVRGLLRLLATRRTGL
ncbi:MAG: hypothetical protein AVDCRST_MAG93-3819, partial [uncultured Chloroflexia bacterium]